MKAPAQDPRRSGGQWLDWVLLAALVGIVTIYIMEHIK